MLGLFSALELLHACALVHDDVIDDSATAGACPLHTCTSPSCTATAAGGLRAGAVPAVRRPFCSATCH